MVGRIMAQNGGTLSPEHLVEECLDEMGAISVSPETRSVLMDFASNEAEGPDLDEQKVADMLGLVAATHEFQRS